MILSSPLGMIFRYIFLLFSLRSFFSVQSFGSAKTHTFKKWSTHLKQSLRKIANTKNRYSPSQQSTLAIHKNFSKSLLKASRLDVITASCGQKFCRFITCWKIGVGDFSVLPIRFKPLWSEPFRSRDLSVLVVSVSSHFDQNMKSCRNLTSSVFNANVLNQRNIDNLQWNTNTSK